MIRAWHMTAVVCAVLTGSCQQQPCSCHRFMCAAGPTISSAPRTTPARRLQYLRSRYSSGSSTKSASGLSVKTWRDHCQMQPKYTTKAPCHKLTSMTRLHFAACAHAREWPCVLRCPTPQAIEACWGHGAHQAALCLVRAPVGHVGGDVEEHWQRLLGNDVCSVLKAAALGDLGFR
jgi:hypothetical protein